MRSLRRGLSLLVVVGVALGGCARYTLIEARTRTIADLYTVEPQIPWSAAHDGKWEIWTVDGPHLAAVQFLNGLEDGEPLFRGGDEPKRIKFRRAMSPTEIAELVVDGMTATGAQRVTVANLRPERFGGVDGFRFELKFGTKGGLDKQAMAAGGVVRDRLYLILYSGAAVHYYAKHRDEAERIIRSVRMK